MLKSASSALRRFRPRPKIGASRVIALRTLRCGSDYGGWDVAVDELPEEPLVYSFGIGEDISFDLALITQRPAAVVHAFDPTPKSIAWLERQALPPRFEAHAYGLAGFDGEVDFFAPANPSHVSHSMVAGAAGATLATRVAVRRLATIMGDLGHDRIDVLKMDIEGAEYGVIDDLAASGLRPRHLFIEFHHRFHGVGPEATRASLRTLRDMGYRLYAVSATEEEYSFLADD